MLYQLNLRSRRFFRIDKMIYHGESSIKRRISLNTKENVTVNREYKSTVFATLFKDKQKLLSLYNALNKSEYSDDEYLEIVTLENAIYMSMKNDLAFIPDCKLTLYEHQSTPNPNMPLRDLFYVSKEYEKLINKKKLYARKKIEIPAPHFVVFYNGIEPQPEQKILKLSDLYKITEKEPMLELQVLMLNINDGNNEVLKESCQALKEYMQYVNRVRNNIYQKKMVLKDAVELAVIECVKEGILAEFLRDNRAEVIAMSIFEFDEERELKLIREAEYQSGLEDGRKAYIECICKKLRKGKNVHTIAEEMDEDVNVIEKIYNIAKDYAPEYNAEDVLKAEINSQK